MKYAVCVVRDVKSEAFGRPFFAKSAAEAIRSFDDEVNRDHPENIMFRHSGDFGLFQLGTFDDADGVFDLLPIPKLLIEGYQCKIKPNTLQEGNGVLALINKEGMVKNA